MKKNYIYIYTYLYIYQIYLYLSGDLSKYQSIYIYVSIYNTINLSKYISI